MQEGECPGHGAAAAGDAIGGVAAQAGQRVTPALLAVEANAPILKIAEQRDCAIAAGAALRPWLHDRSHRGSKVEAKAEGVSQLSFECGRDPL